MKYTITKTVTTYKEASNSDIDNLAYNIVVDLIEDDNISTMEDLNFALQDNILYLTEKFDITDISEIELDDLKKRIREKFLEARKEFIAEELEQLSERQKILDWLTNIISYYSPDAGDPGYYASSEEILNAILKNGKE